eukprot:3195788-Rhodomonas_salina.5
MVEGSRFTGTGVGLTVRADSERFGLAIAKGAVKPRKTQKRNVAADAELRWRDCADMACKCLWMARGTWESGSRTAWK